MTARQDQKPVSIVLLTLPETTPAGVYGLYEMFASAGVAWAEITGEAAGARRIEPRIATLGGAPFSTAVGLPITPHADLRDVASCDAVIVTDLAITLDTDPRGCWPDECEWVRGQARRGAIVCSVCTGTIMLAEAGLLDGLDATTHWCAVDILRKHYPAVRPRPERILCPGGPEHRVVTGGGASSWEDLALYVIARFCGEAEALRIAKIFVVGDRSEGQLPFSALGRPRLHADAVIERCQRWLADHYSGPHPVARMVASSGLPERTFKRRFRAATGYAPVEYVQALRIEEAKQLLETTDDATEMIAHAVGYEDPAFFRRLFKRRTGVTPARYRQRVQAITRMAAVPVEEAAPRRLSLSS